MDISKEKIEKLAAIHKIEIFEGTGPAFEGNVPKDIHADRVLWTKYLFAGSIKYICQNIKKTIQFT